MRRAVRYMLGIGLAVLVSLAGVGCYFRALHAVPAQRRCAGGRDQAAARLPHRGVRATRSTRAMCCPPPARCSWARARGPRSRARRDRTADVGSRGTSKPNGVAFRDGALYVAEIAPHPALRRHRGRGSTSRRKPEVVTDAYPRTSTTAGSSSPSVRTAGCTSGGRALQRLPAPEDPLRHDHALDRPSGARREIVASGVRNTVGFDWHPRTRELWFTDNGRDMMGDDIAAGRAEPRAAARARISAIPYCHGGDIPDPGFGQRHALPRFAPPAPQARAARGRARACASTRAAMFPAEYRGQIFIAEHGSWNRARRSATG